MPITQARIHVGTSGWHYRAWAGPFYPPGLRAKDMLGFYATRFSAAEINASFYRLPSEAAVEGWRDRTPEDFVFTWKASRYLTHLKRLREPAGSLGLMFGRMAPLAGKTGCVLYQLPPQFHADLDRLAAFLGLLPREHRHAIEFRHPSWYAAEIFTLLAAYDVALCIADHAAAPSPWVATAGHVYVRGHGPSGRYWGSYSDADLARWAERILAWHTEGRTVFAFFDNDVKAAAPEDAARLLALLGREGQHRQHLVNLNGG